MNAAATSASLHSGAGKKRPGSVSFAQQRLWVLDQLDLETPSYNISGAIRLTGPLNREALQRALNAIVARHEILRTHFVTVNGLPTQVVAQDRILELGMADLSQSPASEREREFQSLLKAATGRRFNLSSDLLLRAALVKLQAEEHVLVAAMHPIASDDESLRVLFRELAALYEAFSNGNPSPLPELPFQYADFAVRERRYWQGKILEKHVSYWKRTLANLSPLEVPTDRSRPPIQTFRGARQYLALPGSLVESLETLSRQEDASLFVILLAAFKTLLHRYSAQHDIVLGTPIAGRHRTEVERFIGLFASHLVLRADFSGDPTFREVLARVRETMMEASAYQEMPFEKLVEELQPERDLSRHPFFQAVYAFEDKPLEPVAMAGLKVSSVEVDSGTALVDLALSIERRADSLTASLRYNADLFDDATSIRMLGHFERLLEAIVANPGCPVSELPMLTAAERHRLVVERNGTRKDYPKDKRVHELFEAQVERTPDAVALVFEDNKLTYRELNRRANRLARYLRKHGVGPDVFTGIYVERSLEMVVGLLGILKAGGAYVPLDPAHPTERLAFMLEDAQITAAVTEERLSSGLLREGMRMVRLDADWEAIARESGENLSGQGTAENLAYVIYTSGSTGKPKGVQVPHRSVVNFFYSMREQPGLAPDDAMLAVTTISFDPSVLELFLPLMVGARVVIVSREVAADGRRLSERIAQEHIRVMQATPAAWRLLLETGWEGDPRLRILCGGEPLPRALADRLLARSSCLWNLYGPTETTVWSTCHRVEPSDRLIPIGRPIANTEIYLLDSRLQPVPIGVPGELYIGGAGVARGYLNRPELTAERFIRSPFSPGARLYKTGDLARYLASGEIEFLGRIDHQVKVRGFRIELGEIEAVLSQHPAVRGAVVTARENAPGDRRLVAYVVSNPKTATIAELRSFLKEKLPDYMVPSAFVFVKSLPLTPTGKIDRRALPAPSSTDGNRAVDYVPPFYTPEHQLVQIWEELLRVRPIGIRDDFFELGGDSLLAVRMMCEMERICGRELPVATLFAGATIEHLARKLLEEQSGDPSLMVKIQQGGSKRPLFFVHGDFNGGGFYCLNLARGLGDERPFYALNTYGRNGRAIPRSIETIAASYIEMIRTAQPEGPYVLGGFCNGAVLAFEMARQLERQGQKVDLVMMIAYAAWNTRFRILHRFIGALASLLRLGPDKQGDLYESWLARALRCVRFLRKCRARLSTAARAPFGNPAAGQEPIKEIGTPSDSPAPDGAGRGRELYDPEIARAYDRLEKRHVPGAYRGRVVLFWPAEDREEIEDDPALGWGKVAPGIEVQIVPGGHLSCVITHVKVLADRMSACLDTVEKSKKAPYPPTASTFASSLSLLLSHLQDSGVFQYLT